jgi:ADP-ribosyl-[dinitrogen reductase] hydrolase
MNRATEEKPAGAIWGTFIGDALAMPVHWYYDRAALRRDYGIVSDYVAPRNPHPDSILWRSAYSPLNERGDILHEQAQYWGQRGIHYHQFLRAGENTLNLQLGRVLLESLGAGGVYHAEDYLQRYLDFMLTPGRHRDTYVEECHRKFFTAYARGTHPRKCGGDDIHIGGLAHVGLLCACLGGEPRANRDAVREHVLLTHRDPELLRAGDALVQILDAVFAGGGLREAIFEHGSDWLSRRTAEQWSRAPDDVVIGQRVSPACYIADAFPASLYLAWKYADDFEAGLVANTNLGGDNCHRGAVVGALLGAAAGIARIPARFCDGLHDGADLRRQVHRLAA